MMVERMQVLATKGDYKAIKREAGRMEETATKLGNVQLKQLSARPLSAADVWRNADMAVLGVSSTDGACPGTAPISSERAIKALVCDTMAAIDRCCSSESENSLSEPGGFAA